MYQLRASNDRQVHFIGILCMYMNRKSRKNEKSIQFDERTRDSKSMKSAKWTFNLMVEEGLCHPNADEFGRQNRLPEKN